MLAKERHVKGGDKQPRGSLRLQQYNELGWWGASLRDHKERLKKPLTHDQRCDQWFASKVHAYAATQRAGPMKKPASTHVALLK